ncbi:MAG: site-2 protease family protein [Actinomycetota bacterium]|jgi:Zn-dependent protease|nr:site-2 protease family protein [Actinomycetota bacterium]
MSLSSRWRRVRASFSLPNAVITVAIIGIVIFAGVLAVKRQYLTENTAIFLACFVPAVILHEVSHGVVALWCGDDTAKRAGRLTLNPIRHIDPFGSIILPIVMTITAGFPFGYAKPVPVNLSRLRRPRDDAVLVGLAGPATNLILAALSGVVLHFLSTGIEVIGGVAYSTHPLGVGDNFAIDFGVVNILLAVFNLIPIPPLDGSALLERMLPAQVLPQYYRLRFAFMIVVLIVVLYARGPVGSILNHFEVWYLQIFA